jgi:prepilin-type processing-associated H-X9-DG protein
LIVTLAIVAVLVGLAIPAIQIVRRTSRNAVCRDRVRQIGLAAINFESSNARFPNASWFADIGVFLELDPKSVLKVVGTQPDTEVGTVLYCPDEDLPQRDSNGLYSSYLGNNGVWGAKPELEGPIVYPGFAFDGDTPVATASIADGLSQTALFGECLRGGPGRLRTIWELPGAPYEVEEFDQLISACESLPLDPMATGLRGNPRIKGLIITLNAKPDEQGFRAGHYVGHGPSLYNHAVTPQNPSCTNGGIVRQSVLTATSNHDVVNVAFCDGSARSINKSVSRDVWQALGSRMGGESADRF